MICLLCPRCGTFQTGIIAVEPSNQQKKNAIRRANEPSNRLHTAETGKPEQRASQGIWRNLEPADLRVGLTSNRPTVGKKKKKHGEPANRRRRGYKGLTLPTHGRGHCHTIPAPAPAPTPTPGMVQGMLQGVTQGMPQGMPHRHATVGGGGGTRKGVFPRPHGWP